MKSFKCLHKFCKKWNEFNQFICMTFFLSFYNKVFNMLGSEDHHDSSIHFQDETEPLLNGHANGHSKKTETNQDEPQKNDNKPFLTRRQLLTLLSLGITSTLQNASFAILTPFFPVEVSHTSNKHIYTGYCDNLCKFSIKFLQGSSLQTCSSWTVHMLFRAIQ